jgi:hypothetical protein
LSRLAAFLVTAVLFTTGCQSWVVVKQANPNPMVGKTAFALESLHFEAVSIGGKTETAYLSDKEEKTKQSWEADKTDSTRIFGERVRAGVKSVTFTDAATPGAQFLVRALVTYWEPGSFAVVVNIPSEMRISLTVSDDKGAILDEVAFKRQIGASMTSPSSGDRMRSAAQVLGDDVARYLNTRVVAGK